MEVLKIELSHVESDLETFLDEENELEQRDRIKKGEQLPRILVEVRVEVPLQRCTDEGDEYFATD